MTPFRWRMHGELERLTTSVPEDAESSSSLKPSPDEPRPSSSSGAWCEGTHQWPASARTEQGELPAQPAIGLRLLS